MNTRQFLQYQSIRNCQLVLQDKRFKGPEIATLRKRFNDAADEVQKLWDEQERGQRESRGEAGDLQRMRIDLRKRLLRISRRAVVVLDGMPGIRDDLRVPHANVKTADLLKASTRLVRNLRPHLRALHEEGLPANAIPELLAAVKAIKERSAAPADAMARRARATRALPPAIRRARTIARALDSVITGDFVSHDTVPWKMAFRIPGKKGRPRKRRTVLVS